MKEPKYRQLADEMRQKITSGEWPRRSRLMTEARMAETYAVGRQTVRQAMDLLSSEGLVYRRQGSGTFVAGSASTAKASRLIGLITTFASYYIFPDILGSIEDGLRANDCRILLSATQNRFTVERSILQDMLRQPIDGLIVECTCPQIPNPNIDLYRCFYEQGIPVIFLNGEYYGLDGCVSVRVDDERAGCELTRHMIDLGARSFGGLFRTDYHGYRRFKGFFQACIDANARVDEEACKWFSDNESKETLGYLLSRADIDRLEQLDAMICYNDAVALNALSYLRQNGCRRIPRIASFDNTQILQLSREPVVAITYPSKTVGNCVVEKLMNMIRGEAEASIVLPWEADWPAEVRQNDGERRAACE